MVVAALVQVVWVRRAAVHVVRALSDHEAPARVLSRQPEPRHGAVRDRGVRCKATGTRCGRGERTIFTTASVAFFVLLGYAVEQLAETY